VGFCRFWHFFGLRRGIAAFVVSIRIIPPQTKDKSGDASPQSKEMPKSGYLGKPGKEFVARGVVVLVQRIFAPSSLCRIARLIVRHCAIFTIYHFPTTGTSVFIP
jgi:hypothetical protein